MNLTIGFKWTDTAIADLTRMWSGGMSGSQIAKELGTGRSSVMGKIHRLELCRTDESTRQSRRFAAIATAERNRKRRPAHLTKPRTTPQPPVEPAMEIDDTPDHEIPVSQRRTLLQLEPGMCRWPVGHPGTPDFFFCAGAALADQPYCATHTRRAYQPASHARRAFVPRRGMVA